jgi:hypothetical protein
VAVVKRAVLLALFTIAMFDPTDTRMPFMLGEVVSGRALTDFYVSASGSASSGCTVGDPCTMTRAVAICNAGTISPGDTVHLAAGVYNEPVITLGSSSCNGTEGNHIKWVGASVTASSANYAALGLDTGTRFVGTTHQVVVASVSLTSGRTYTYEYPWDEASTGWSVSYVAQRPPAPAFDTITVDEGDNKEWQIAFPPRYRNNTSIAAVEAQSCSAWNDTTANKVYFHLCDSEAPTANHNVYLVRSGYGSILVAGDYHWIENVQFEHGSSSGYGLRVDSTSEGFQGENLYFRAASFRTQGTNGTIDGLNSRAVAIQGPSGGAGCLITGIGSCWDDDGGGTAVEVGIPSSAASTGNVLANADVRMFWNAMKLSGANTIRDSIAWGGPNHALSIDAGTGSTVLRVIVDNAQEGVHFNADTLNFSITYSIFPRAVVLGNTIGPTTTPVGGTFTHNITSKINANDAVADTGGLTSDCNLFLPNYGGLDTADIYEWGVTTPGVSYNNLTDIRNNTANEDNSVHLADDAYWAALFENYVMPATANPDYRPVSSSAQQINMPGSCGYAGPYSSFTGEEPSSDDGRGHGRRLIRLRRPV